MNVLKSPKPCATPVISEFGNFIFICNKWHIVKFLSCVCFAEQKKINLFSHVLIRCTHSGKNQMQKECEAWKNWSSLDFENLSNKFFILVKPPFPDMSSRFHRFRVHTERASPATGLNFQNQFSVSSFSLKNNFEHLS